MAPRRPSDGRPPRRKPASAGQTLDLHPIRAERASGASRKPASGTRKAVSGDAPTPRGRTKAAAPARGNGGNGGTGRGRGGQGGGGGRRGGRRKRSLIRRLFGWTMFVAVWGVIGVVGLFTYYAATLPPTSEWAVPERPPNVKIVSERGDLIANRGDTGGQAVTLAEMSPHLPEAVMAIEDRRFRDHFGIDPIGLARAAASNLRAGGLVEGGSTLTQQLAKNLFLTPERTIERKMQEVLMALWLEAKYSKDEILEMYLNRVYLGAGAYGVDAAAQRYFDTSARNLDLAQSAMIAGLLKAPTRYAPTNHPEAAAARARVVLQAMAEEGYITPIEAQIASANPAQVVSRATSPSAGYVADWVNDVLPGFVGAIDEDIVVETTIDLGLQEMAQSALQTTLSEQGEKLGVEQGAIVVMDGGGAVKALVGGRDYRKSQYNRAVTAKRQPGSSFKPFVYLTAMELGYTPETILVDEPVKIGNWSPENYNRKHYGPVTLTRGLAHSLNTIAAKLADQVGPSNVVRTAHRLGIHSKLDPNASIALGTSEVTLLELTSAYVPFSNGGFGVVPHVIQRIVTSEGKVLYKRSGTGPGRVISDLQVGQMNAMLSEALTSGTAQRAQIEGWPAGGKTGTSQDWRDAWFVGYTAYFTAGVWLGNDDNSSTKRATGGSAPAELWRSVMQEVHQGMAVADLPGAKVSGSVPVASADVPLDGPNPDASPTVSSGQPGGNRRSHGAWVPPEQNVDGGGFFRRLFGG
ncbi:transglycosylase domain-containing protein [Amorphus orientalis]|uniref:Penicillin-binding protein 1A n=1 Tax=Amorphus orientalis TaxID=649198 RepID=A0AAE3VRP6_9HYPH|nr:PBP1A family penicillin-binding protein [Amorphus orientalis]MDQ0316600.1 penicillin-binding protein 1A [Amorphus orientalis]